MFDDTNSIITIRKLEGSYTMAKGKKTKRQTTVHKVKIEKYEPPYALGMNSRKISSSYSTSDTFRFELMTLSVYTFFTYRQRWIIEIGYDQFKFITKLRIAVNNMKIHQTWKKYQTFKAAKNKALIHDHDCTRLLVLQRKYFPRRIWLFKVKIHMIKMFIRATFQENMSHHWYLHQDMAYVHYNT